MASGTVNAVGLARPEGVRLPAINLWDDNPSELDLLGFDTVVAPIAAALRHPRLDPITIGVHAPWGGGKSTLLKLIQQEIEKESWIVIRVNPWEFDDQFDVKGSLIARVLDALEVKYAAQEGVTGRIKSLADQISWSRLGLAVASGVLTMNFDPEHFVKVFNPTEKHGAESMAQFHKGFADLLVSIREVERVVVLVDDLDRCLPPAVLATLEAIKLFLAVPKMAFVIAADQNMVKDAIAATLAGTNRSETFAERYLEKIVQLPVSVPMLSPAESEAYIALLLAYATNGDRGFDKLVERVRERRKSKLSLLGSFADLENPPSQANLDLAAQLNQGLTPSRRGNPREIKRFLNAFSVRNEMASSRGLSISPAQLMKMLLLEERYEPEFKYLAALREEERLPRLQAWEAWAVDEKALRPEGISDNAREWAGGDPKLDGDDLASYITLAATLSAAPLAAGLTDELRRIMQDLLSQGQSIRDDAKELFAGLPSEDLRRLQQALLDAGRTLADERVAHLIEALAAIAKAQPTFAPDIAAGIRERLWRRLPPAAPVELHATGIQDLVKLVELIAASDTVRPETKEAAKGVLTEGV
jgi:hypothetical protein